MRVSAQRLDGEDDPGRRGEHGRQELWSPDHTAVAAPMITSACRHSDRGRASRVSVVASDTALSAHMRPPAVGHRLVGLPSPRQSRRSFDINVVGRKPGMSTSRRAGVHGRVRRASGAASARSQIASVAAGQT